MEQTRNPTLIDTRGMDAKLRRTQVFAAFDKLAVGERLEVVSEQEPQTLRSQFELEKARLFAWEALESGPAVWRVGVVKLKDQASRDHCCGACAG